MRQTSIEVYHQIESEGLLSKKRWEVYREIFKHGPITQGELWNKCFKNEQRHTIAPRFAELQKLGVIDVVEIRSCKLTGRKCLSWDVTKRLPIKQGKPKNIKCCHCNGKGFVTHQQLKMF